MITKPLGKTGKTVSALGFGGMRFDTNRSLEDNAALVKLAYDKGISYFDTAPYYCKGTSESIYGLAFREMPREKFIVSTKTMAKDDPTADAVRRRVETSLQRMGLEKIDILHMWCILDREQYDQVLQPGGPYAGALRLKEEGLIDHIFFSVHAPGAEIARMVQDHLYEGVTLGYSAMNFPYRKLGLEAAYREGLAVITMNPLGGGVIPRNQEYFSFLQVDPKYSVAQSALRFNAAHREIAVTLCGFSTAQEIEEGVAAMEDLELFTPGALDRLRQHIVDHMDQVCTNCHYCLPCPKGLDIPGFMEVYNYYLLKGKEAAQKEYDISPWLIEPDAAHLPDACIGCGVCEKRCTQKLPIIQRMAWCRDHIRFISGE